MYGLLQLGTFVANVADFGGGGLWGKVVKNDPKSSQKSLKRT